MSDLHYGDPAEHESTPAERRASTPAVWAGASDLGHDVFMRREPGREGAGAYGLWHWCTLGDRWAYAVPGKHDLIADDPLHLEPSLLWPCCGKHGFVRDGRWAEA